MRQVTKTIRMVTHGYDMIYSTNIKRSTECCAESADSSKIHSSLLINECWDHLASKHIYSSQLSQHF